MMCLSKCNKLIFSSETFKSKIKICMCLLQTDMKLLSFFLIGRIMAAPISNNTVILIYLDMNCIAVAFPVNSIGN